MGKKVTKILTPKDYKSLEHTWCPGCGDAGILVAIHKALAELQIPPHMVAVIGGIGCFAKTPEYIKCCGVNWLHGRELAFAIGVKLANPKLTVFSVGGDGDNYGIGIEHIFHACRRNPDVVSIVSNNQVFALTKGQASPTSHKDLITSTTPRGAKDEPVDAVALAVEEGAAFVARGYAYNQKELTELIVTAIQHRGYSLIDVLSPCVTWHREPNYDNLRDYYNSIMIPIEEAGHKEFLRHHKDSKLFPYSYDPTDKETVQRVLRYTREVLGKMPVGLLYKKDVVTMGDNAGVDPENPIVELDISVETNRRQYEEFKEKFR